MVCEDDVSSVHSITMESIYSDNSLNSCLDLIDSIEKYQNFKSEVNFKNVYNLRPNTKNSNTQNSGVAKFRKGFIFFLVTTGVII